MAYYLVKAIPRADRLARLEAQLRAGAFVHLRPFGRVLSASLRQARRQGAWAVWEEEDYCTPPLAEERAAVLDGFFDALTTEPVREGEGWQRIDALPPLFPGLHDAP